MILRGLKAVIYKEFIQFRRDPATRFVFLIPVMQTIVFGFAINMEVLHIPTVVADFDRGAASRRLIAQFENTGNFDILREVENSEALRREIVAGRAKVGLLIPPDFGARRLRGESATAQVLIDGSDSTVATSALQAAGLVGLVASSSGGGGGGGDGVSTLAVDVRPRVLFNPDLVSSHFFVPGLVGIVLQLVTVLLTAFSIVRERERGTLEQLAVTPVSKTALILGKLLPYAVIGFIQAPLMLSLMRWVFGVRIEGDLFLLLALSVLFLLPSLALGILISTLSTNQAEAMQLSLLLMLPSILLSGFAFPREAMPDVIYALTFLIPVTYYEQILRGIILRGAGLWALWPQTLALAGFAVALVTLSALRFQKRLS